MAAKPNEIQIIRVYDAPVKLVWDAWTDPKQVEKWWGPRGFTLTTKSKELRPGGKWIYTMHGPDGTDYPNISTYHEVIPYEKLVYDHGGNEEREKLFSVVATFKETKGKTTLMLTFTVPTAEEAREMKKFIKLANGNSTWDRLGEHLQEKITGEDPFIIARTFETDIKTLFKLWVDPEHLAKWMGPAGSTMHFIKTNVKEGGTSRWAMSMGESGTMYGQIDYKTIRPHDLFVYTQNFCDEAGTLIKPPFAPNYPDRVRTTVTFAEEDAGQTRLTLQWNIEGAATAEEKATFREMKTSMTGGWTGSFDKLEDLFTTGR